MKPGDLVSVYYETFRYYIIMEELPRHLNEEKKMKLFCLSDGKERIVSYSNIKVINKA
tara:strand:- start:17 stop:190 length:174 start_codon:yes stop_codon:yes gene_type:complete